MPTLETYREPRFVAMCQRIIDECVKETGNVKNIIIATVDGFEIAATVSSEDNNNDKLAAVGSSLFALSSSLSQELKLDDCQSLTIDSEKGKIYVRLVEASENKKLILLIQANKIAMLANILHASNKAAAKISNALELLKS